MPAGTFEDPDIAAVKKQLENPTAEAPPPPGPKPGDYIPYQPNPGAPEPYNPNPGARYGQSPSGAILGRLKPAAEVPSPSAAPAAPTEPAPPEPKAGESQMVTQAPAPQNPVVIPGGWSPSSQTTTVARGMSPAALQASELSRMEALGQGVAGTAKHVEASKMRADAEIELADKQAKIYEDSRLRQQAIENQRRAFVEKENGVLQQLSDNAKNAEQNFWKEKGTLAQVLSAVFIGMGEFGKGPGGQNNALNIINGAIQRNIDASRQALGDRRAQYQKNLEAFGDSERAEAALRSQALDQVLAIANKQRAKSKGIDAEGEGHDFIAKLYQEKAKSDREFAALTADKYNETLTQNYRPAQVVYPGGQPLKREGNLVTTEDGTTYQFDNDTQANKAADRLQAFSEVKAVTNRILETRAQLKEAGPFGSESSALEERLNKLGLDLLQAQSRAKGQGVVTEADMKANDAKGLNVTSGLGLGGRTADMLGGSYYEETNKNFQKLQQDNLADEAAFLRATGPKVYRKTYATDPATGRIVPTGSYTGQDARPVATAPPFGSKALDGSLKATQMQPASETTPAGPFVSSQAMVPSSGLLAPKRKGKR